jgi:hypothetical protein
LASGKEQETRKAKSKKHPRDERGMRELKDWKLKLKLKEKERENERELVICDYASLRIRNTGSYRD